MYYSTPPVKFSGKSPSARHLSPRLIGRRLLAAAAIGLLGSAGAFAEPLGFIAMRVYVPEGGSTGSAKIVLPTLTFESQDGTKRTVAPCADQTAANAEFVRAQLEQQTECAWSLAYNATGLRSLNIAGPETAASYWITPFLPVDSLKSIRIQGQFTDTRYMSFVTYDNEFNTWLPPSENPQVTDHEIIPDTGYLNPWQQPALAGGRFTLDVVRNHNANGYNPNLLPMPPAQEGDIFKILNAMPDPDLNCSPGYSCMPANQFGRMPEDLEAGMGPNEDSGYIISNNDFGKGRVQVIRAKMPSVTSGDNPLPWISSGKQLRYLSLCTYPLVKPYPVASCLRDEEIKLDKDGYYTFVVGQPEDKPGSVEKRGHNWLPYTDKNLVEHTVALRNMVTQVGFSKSATNVPKDGSPTSAKNVMQEFYPDAKVCTVASYQLRGANCTDR